MEEVRACIDDVGSLQATARIICCPRSHLRRYMHGLEAVPPRRVVALRWARWGVVETEDRADRRRFQRVRPVPAKRRMSRSEAWDCVHYLCGRRRVAALLGCRLDRIDVAAREGASPAVAHALRWLRRNDPCCRPEPARRKPRKAEVVGPPDWLSPFVERVKRPQAAKVMRASVERLDNVLRGKATLTAAERRRLKAAAEEPPMTVAELWMIVSRLGGEEAVAEAVGRRPATVRSWMAGTRPIPFDMMRRLRRIRSRGKER